MPFPECTSARGCLAHRYHLVVAFALVFDWGLRTLVFESRPNLSARLLQIRETTTSIRA